MRPKNQAYIGQMLVTSDYAFIVYGNVRGLVSSHRTLSGARRSLDRDRKACAAQGSGHYSDARVYEWTGSEWDLEMYSYLRD